MARSIGDNAVKRVGVIAEPEATSGVQEIPGLVGGLLAVMQF